MADPLDDLTPKRRKFVAEYCVDLNATQAAIRAGYAPRTANREGTFLLSNPVIRQLVDERLAAQTEKVDLTAEQVTAAVRAQVLRDVRALFDAEGNFIPIHQLPKDVAAMIAGFDVVTRNLAVGDGATDRVVKVKLQDQRGYVELALKMLGLLIEKKEVGKPGQFRKLTTEQLREKAIEAARTLGLQVVDPTKAVM